LNKYNSIDHLAIGIGIGTLAYRKAGGGLRGVAAGLVAGTIFNALWEPFENLYVFKDANGLTSIDTISDVAMVYSGVLLNFLGEKAKNYLNRDKIKKEEKWLL